MSRLARCAFAAWLGTLALLGFAPEARACSVCLAGDPTFSTHGASAQSAGDFSLYLEARAWSKRSAALSHEEEMGAMHGEEEEHHGDHEEAGNGEEAEHAATEENRSQRLDLYASWTPADRLTLTLNLPWAFNSIRESEAGESSYSTLSGVGDVSLGSSFVLWRDREVMPSTWLEGRLWLKAPTGRDDTEVDGVRDPHLQPGTGSWDFGFGVAGVHRRSWGSLYASVFWRENTPGSLDYRYGDVLLATAAIEAPLGHAVGRPELDWLTGGLALDYRYAGYDHADGEVYEHSGGSMLYLAPSLRIRLPFGVGARPASLRAAVQVPLTQSWLNGTQTERAVYSLGVLVPF